MIICKSFILSNYCGLGFEEKGSHHIHSLFNTHFLRLLLCSRHYASSVYEWGDRKREVERILKHLLYTRYMIHIIYLITTQVSFLPQKQTFFQGRDFVLRGKPRWNLKIQSKASHKLPAHIGKQITALRNVIVPYTLLWSDYSSRDKHEHGSQFLAFQAPALWDLSSTGFPSPQCLLCCHLHPKCTLHISFM